MHTEYYEVSKEAEEIINRGKREGKKIIAVGTTSVRTLETGADKNGFVKAGSGNTNIFIYPGYTFKCVDKIITNIYPWKDASKAFEDKHLKEFEKQKNSI